MEPRRDLRRQQQKLQSRGWRLAQRREQHRPVLPGIGVGIGQLDDSRGLSRLAQPVVQQRIVGFGGQRVIAGQRSVIGKMQKRDRRTRQLDVIGDRKRWDGFAQARQRATLLPGG